MRLPADAPPELRAYAKHMARVARAERLCLRTLRQRAKDDRSTLHQAARAIVGELPQAKRAEALEALDRVIEDYRRRVRDRAEARAMSPRHKGDR